MGPFNHIGVACNSKEEIDAKVALAEGEGVLRRTAQQSSAPVGYWAFFADPDGNTLELSYGQQLCVSITLNITSLKHLDWQYSRASITIQNLWI